MAEPFNLASKDLDLEALTHAAATDRQVLQQLLDGVSPASKKATLRHNCSEALMRLAEQQPDALLPQWDYLVDRLHSGNSFSQYVAIHALASRQFWSLCASRWRPRVRRPGRLRRRSSGSGRSQPSQPARLDRARAARSCAAICPPASDELTNGGFPSIVVTVFAFSAEFRRDQTLYAIPAAT